MLFQNETIAFVEQKLFNFDSLMEDRGVVFPKHMKDFIINQLPKWVESSFEARNHIENQTYVVRDSLYYQDDLPPHRVIAPVNLDTGVVQFKLNWGDGLTQFLQIKHGLQMNSESLVSVFQSYVGYFLKYSGNIYGLTGTLGTVKHQEFLYKMYHNVDFVFIPNHIQKKLTILPDIVTIDNTKLWLDNIIEEVRYKALEDGRPVLIIAKTIESMRHISSAIKDTFKNSIYTGKYIVKEYGEISDHYVISGISHPGDIIVATNLAGRGTDLKISTLAEKKWRIACDNFLFTKQYQSQRTRFWKSCT